VGLAALIIRLGVQLVAIGGKDKDHMVGYTQYPQRVEGIDCSKVKNKFTSFENINESNCFERNK
jgi:hypothetical protein